MVSLAESFWKCDVVARAWRIFLKWTNPSSTEGTTDWAFYEIPFYLNKEQICPPIIWFMTRYAPPLTDLPL